MATATYTVEGMHCAHCVATVSREIAGVAGVRTVEVDLDSGLVTVDSAAPVDEGAVRAAVEAAGYRVAR